MSHEEFVSFQGKVLSMLASMESRIEALATRMESRDQEVRQELVIYKAAVSARVMATRRHLRWSHMGLVASGMLRSWITSYGIWSDTSRLSH